MLEWLLFWSELLIKICPKFRRVQRSEKFVASKTQYLFRAIPISPLIHIFNFLSLSKGSLVDFLGLPHLILEKYRSCLRSKEVFVSIKGLLQLHPCCPWYYPISFLVIWPSLSFPGILKIVDYADGSQVSDRLINKLTSEKPIFHSV